jgi:hypothetical protein
MARSRRRLLAVAAVASVLLAFACNGIVGLDDYEKVSCTGGRCDGGAPDALTDVVIDGNRADARVDASGTLPVSWAHFRMPNYVVDGGPDANLMAYTPASGGILDTVTKLVWREPIPDAERNARTWEEAQKICAAAGPEKWRLPSRIELVTLLDLTQRPAVDKVFQSTDEMAYWTTSEVRGLPAADRRRWTVNFTESAGVGTAKENGDRAGVRCVKAQ